MNLLKAIEERHSVRSYTDRPIEGETLDRLQKLVDNANKASGLHIQLVLNEPKAFDSKMAHYGKFSGVKNYIALIGKRDKDLDEKCGYYGESIVIGAQMLGLNTCWVALTYKKIPDAFTVENDEKLLMVIAIGYGIDSGRAHSGKFYDEVTSDKDSPQWFKSGVEAALLAPTAMNQQKFSFTLKDGKVLAKAKFGACSKTDLGIVKYHFEIGSGKDSDIWL
ncbi:MAG: nitroreductase [Ruminococcus sp.]|nr:nitroreductase [Ruminococcus sp.]